MIVPWIYCILMWPLMTEFQHDEDDLKERVLKQLQTVLNDSKYELAKYLLRVQYDLHQVEDALAALEVPQGFGESKVLDKNSI